MNKSQNLPESITIPMLPLRGLVMFPNMVLHFDVGREKSIEALNDVMAKNRRIYLVAQKDVRDDEPDYDKLYDIGVVAEVKQIIKSSGAHLRVMVEGLYRAKTLKIIDSDQFLKAEIIEYPLKDLRKNQLDMSSALIRTVKDLFDTYCYLSPKMPKDIILNTVSSDDPVYIAEYITSNMSIRVDKKQSILMESSINKRLEILASIIESENTILELEHNIYDKVKEQIDKNQREYYLREQQKIISSELGESGDDDAYDYMTKIMSLRLSDESEEKLLNEAHRLSKLPSNSHEGGVIRTYLDTCLELPWNKSTKDKIDLVKAAKLLDKEHYGMTKIKDRILELLAVRYLAPNIKGQIICLVGPPGVGKTSIARSIAKSMGRSYTRISLGGVRDEADIRGHRKTYIGAMPGRIINALKLAGTKNPLMLLDEVDKLGNDFRGDPSSALLEVLDSEQNSSFRDHYIEIPFDLSDVLFIATANNINSIPAPLLDRMEVINLTSYTREEKFHIAKEHLLTKQLKKHGLTARNLKLEDSAIYSLIDFYTREAGVRKLEREIGSICRKSARDIVSNGVNKIVVTKENIEKLLGPKKYRPDELHDEDEVGVVNGLAWTSVGGEILEVEVAIMDGTGKLELTGSLGDVMKESAKAAISYIRSCADIYGIDKDFYKNKDIHIHVPEGAVPKDGPSAGITICTALVSALSGIPVKRDLAMTGEISLRGRVMPIGGLKEKTMAAYRTGVKTVIIPKDNVSDLHEVDPVVKSAINFIPADRIETVLKTALISGEFKKAEIKVPVDMKKPAINETIITQ